MKVFSQPYNGSKHNYSGNVFGFALKLCGVSDSALPPDVRRWLCPAGNRQFVSWAGPRFGLGPLD